MSEKIVFITGGSRGIGRAIVHAFARNGYRVLFTYNRNLREAEKVANEIKVFYGGEALFYQMDVSNPESIREVYRKISGEVAYINVLVNNAGILHIGGIEETSLEDWERTLRVNVTGVFLTIRTFLPLLRKASWASIVNVASIAGQTGHIAASVAYAASKAAVIGLTRKLAVELAPHIRVNAVAPSFVETDMVRSFIDTPEKRKQVEELHPLRSIAKPEDVAEAVLFLADPKRSRFITGQVIGVNGGRLIC